MHSNPVSLDYEERGTGLPVVLLHGYPFSRRIWQAQQDALSDSYRIITPDLRGLGSSPAPDGIYHMDDLAADVVALIDGLGIERAVWVGHSMGGYVTMAALRTVPERVLAVGLVATHPVADSPDKRGQRLATAEAVLVGGSVAAVADSMIGSLVAPGTPLDSPPLRAVWDIMASTFPAGIAGALRGMAARPDSWETLRAITSPALILAGAQDQIVPRALVEQMAQAVPHALVRRIDGAGHLPMIEQPSATAAALREWLDSLSDR